MKPPYDPLQAGAFVDGELDLANQLTMEASLRTDAGLRQQVDALRDLQGCVRGATYHVTPQDLRQQIESMARAQLTSRPAQPAAVAHRLRRWLAWRPLVASFGVAAAVMLVVNMAWLQTSAQDQLLQEVVAGHVRSTLGQHLVDVASSDHHTVKPWLSARLGFSPPVHELGLPGSVFLGGRVDYIDGRPVAALVYRQGEHVVNSFVWPGAGASSDTLYGESRGFRTAHWSHDGMAHWVISDVNSEEFKSVVQAIQGGDGAP